MTKHFATDDIYLTVEEVAERYRVSPATIWRWKRAGDFPRAVKVGPGCTRWRLKDIIEHDSTLRTCFATNANFLFSSEQAH
ncbi:helix-turn-helix domain-containing protein (plasmid) [Pseudorhodobacter turbinis]|uniref:Helix-turn-helix domain-containing protein n=1 Tax=Pseudorhodobacter turbinis TaxID=2500533 RepID=A0A4P8EK64_9RHOB|nr:helix-turn-helix domain-containing protein [Pseudorhodobacter turbinis]QCO57389.1 helix-turn-helix domain-containing protein [Pseudorhodobacter turbinis]